jgi:hypothetical protein
MSREQYRASAVESLWHAYQAERQNPSFIPYRYRVYEVRPGKDIVTTAVTNLAEAKRLFYHKRQLESGALIYLAMFDMYSPNWSIPIDEYSIT